MEILTAESLLRLIEEKPPVMAAFLMLGVQVEHKVSILQELVLFRAQGQVQYIHLYCKGLIVV